MSDSELKLSGRRHGAGRAKLSDTMRARLIDLRDRSGEATTVLLDEAEDAPDGLTADIIQSWLTGKVATARRDHLEYVAALWRQGAHGDTARVVLSDELRDTLREHMRRSGKGPIPLLREAAGLPRGLGPAVVASWMEGRARTARRDHLDFVLGRWQAAIEAGGRYVEITDEVRASLKAARDRTGISPDALLRDRADVPEGLTPLMIYNWMTGRTAAAREEHLGYVLERWLGSGSRPLQSVSLARAAEDGD